VISPIHFSMGRLHRVPLKYEQYVFTPVSMKHTHKCKKSIMIQIIDSVSQKRLTGQGHWTETQLLSVSLTPWLMWGLQL